MEEKLKKSGLNKDLEKLLTDKSQPESYHIDKITDKVYLGDIDGASQYDYFSKENITHVLSIINNSNINLSDNNKIAHKLLKLDDEENANLIKYFKECIEFIENSGKIFVHCLAGISRSPTIVISYLMWKAKVSFYDAYFFVKSRRPFISPNPGFERQLKIFGDLLEKNNYYLNKIDFEKIQI